MLQRACWEKHSNRTEACGVSILWVASLLYCVLLIVDTLLLMTLGLQFGNNLTAVGICRIIACTLHNAELSDVIFDIHPSDCILHAAWLREGLAVPPDHVARQGMNLGWSPVLKYLRKLEQDVRVICARSHNISCSNPHSLRRSPPSHLLY